MTTRTYPDHFGAVIRESSFEKALEIHQLLGTPSADVAIEVAIHYALRKIKEDIMMGQMFDKKQWFTVYNYLQEGGLEHA